MAKQGSVSVARALTRSLLSTSVLSAALLSAVLVSPAFAGEALPPPTPSSAASLPASSNPANNSTAGQMMAMQQAAMGQSANTSTDPFQGNVPKSTSLSANFAWADTFNAMALNGGYGGGVTVTRWITANSGINMNVEILSFGLGNLNNTLSQSYPAVGHQAGTPIIPITLGYVYDVTGGKSWINPQVFADGGLAVTLNGESAPLVMDAGFGVVAPMAKLADALAGIDLFANIRWAYISNIGGLADTAVGADFNADGTNIVRASGGALNYMPVEFGATFVF
ncbi:MAG: hypothetical protein M1537_06235 [Nitrospirae bacterium]|nr:hypothetical protein [Nitrospirota bacterium]MCL5285343.1 hypothetical protein [Nitrospirota bacterium]